MEKVHLLKPKLRERYNRKGSNISFSLEYLEDLKQYNSNNINANKKAALAQNELDDMLLTPQNRDIVDTIRVHPAPESFHFENQDKCMIII